MLKKVILFLLMIAGGSVTAQFHEIGVFLGGSNYIGDVGTDRFVDPNQLAYGILYKWNMTDRYSLRAGFTATTLSENEYGNSDINRFRRSFKIDNPIQEALAGIEINFTEFNLHDPTTIVTPYLFYGLSYFRFNQYYLTPNGPIDPPTYTNYGKMKKSVFL